MIYKLITHHKANPFEDLLQYMTHQTGELDGDTHRFLFTHNIRQDQSLKDIAKAYKVNDSYRKKRIRGVSGYHEILSYHKGDTHHLSEEKLQDIARHYVSLRGNRALYTVFIHYDQDHIHLHSMVSGNQFKSAETTRLSLKDLKLLKQEIQRYQIMKYPELEHSRPDHSGTKTKLHRQRWETQKSRIIEILEQCFSQAKSPEDFYKQVERKGIEIYRRNGKITGVRYGRKYRLNRLGFNQDHIAMLDREVFRLKEIQKLRGNTIQSEIDKEAFKPTGRN